MFYGCLLWCNTYTFFLITYHFGILHSLFSTIVILFTSKTRNLFPGINPKSCPACHQVANIACAFDLGCHNYETRTVNHGGCRVWRVPWSFQGHSHFCRRREWIVAFLSLFNILHCSSGSQNCYPGRHIPPDLCILYWYCGRCPLPKYVLDISR